MGSVSEELARLAQLRDQGVLTEAEFERQKAAVLATDQPATPPKKSMGVAGKGCLAIFAIIVILGIIGAIAGSKGGTSANSDKASAPTVAPTKVTVTELFNADKANEAAAQQVYGDRPLLVTGTADKVDLDISDTPELLLRTPNEFMSAHAALADESKSKAASIAPGQKMTLLCGGVNEMMSIPMLKDCVIQ